MNRCIAVAVVLLGCGRVRYDPSAIDGGDDGDAELEDRDASVIDGERDADGAVDGDSSDAVADGDADAAAPLPCRLQWGTMLGGDWAESIWSFHVSDDARILIALNTPGGVVCEGVEKCIFEIDAAGTIVRALPWGDWTTPSPIIMPTPSYDAWLAYGAGAPGTRVIERRDNLGGVVVAGTLNFGVPSGSTGGASSIRPIDESDYCIGLGWRQNNLQAFDLPILATPVDDAAYASRATTGNHGVWQRSWDGPGSDSARPLAIARDGTVTYFLTSNMAGLCDGTVCTDGTDTPIELTLAADTGATLSARLRPGLEDIRLPSNGSRIELYDGRIEVARADGRTFTLTQPGISWGFDVTDDGAYMALAGRAETSFTVESARFEIGPEGAYYLLVYDAAGVFLWGDLFPAGFYPHWLGITSGPRVVAMSAGVEVAADCRAPGATFESDDTNPTGDALVIMLE